MKNTTDESSSLSQIDYWTGPFALVAFALAEVIVFSFVLGIGKAWEEIDAVASCTHSRSDSLPLTGALPFNLLHGSDGLEVSGEDLTMTISAWILLF